MCSKSATFLNNLISHISFASFFLSKYHHHSTGRLGHFTQTHSRAFFGRILDRRSLCSSSSATSISISSDASSSIIVISFDAISAENTETSYRHEQVKLCFYPFAYAQGRRGALRGREGSGGVRGNWRRKRVRKERIRVF